MSNNLVFTPSSLPENTDKLSSLAQVFFEENVKLIHEKLIPHFYTNLNQLGVVVTMEQLTKAANLPYCQVIQHTGVRDTNNKDSTLKGTLEPVEGNCCWVLQTGKNKNRYCPNKAGPNGYCTSCSKKDLKRRSAVGGVTQQDVRQNFNNLMQHQPTMMEPPLDMYEESKNIYRLRNTDLLVVKNMNNNYLAGRLVNGVATTLDYLTVNEDSLLRQYNLMFMNNNKPGVRITDTPQPFQLPNKSQLTINEQQSPVGTFQLSNFAAQLPMPQQQFMPTPQQQFMPTPQQPSTNNTQQQFMPTPQQPSTNNTQQPSTFQVSVTQSANNLVPQQFQLPTANLVPQPFQLPTANLAAQTMPNFMFH